MIVLREDFIDGQITCPECQKIQFERGQIGGRLRWVFSHKKADGSDCEGAGARVPLETLTDAGAMAEKRYFYSFLLLLNCWRVV